MLRFRLAAFARAFVSQCFKGSFVIIILHVQLSKTRVQSLLYHATPFLPHPISHPSPPLGLPPGAAYMVDHFAADPAFARSRA